MLAVKANGTVWATGYNGAGQLGLGSTTPTFSYSPVQVPGLSGIVQVSQGYGHSLAADGRRWGWGDNAFGEVGDGTTTPRYSPTLMVGP